LLYSDARTLNLNMATAIAIEMTAKRSRPYRKTAVTELESHRKERSEDSQGVGLGALLVRRGLA
jgi:hypothetical protein